VLAITRKEKLQEEIEHQLELGGESLREEDKWMMEVNLGDLSEGTGERECYWLLAVQAAREHRPLIEQRSSGSDSSGNAEMGSICRRSRNASWNGPSSHESPGLFGEIWRIASTIFVSTL
jgi:hypothetical protein